MTVNQDSGVNNGMHATAYESMRYLLISDVRVPKKTSAKLSSFDKAGDDKRFKSIQKQVEYHKSNHMIKYLVGDFHKKGDDQKVKINVKCFRVRKNE